MHIKEITYRNRRDFKAIYKCASCGWEKEDWGYDDANFHNNVIPKMKCEKCGAVGGGPASSPTIPADVVL